MMARRLPGVSEAQAQSALAVWLGQLRSEPSAVGRNVRLLARIELQPGGKGLSDLRTRFSQPLRILMAIVSLLLLIA